MTEKLIPLFKKSKKFVIDEKENFIFDGTATRIKVPIFIYDLKQPKKAEYSNFVKDLWNFKHKRRPGDQKKAKIETRKRIPRVAKKNLKRKPFPQKGTTQKRINYLQRNTQTLEVFLKAQKKK